MEHRRVRIPILGLTCGGGGIGAVERELSRTPGVMAAFGNPATEAAYVTYDPMVVGIADLRDAIERAGYTPGPLAGRS